MLRSSSRQELEVYGQFPDVPHLGKHRVVTVDSLIDKNWSVFVKIDKISMIRFCWFIENRSVEFENFEIKNSKKQLAFISSFFVKTKLKIQNMSF
jgi:hypothetical protein